MIGSLTRTNTYLDTLVGADPVADIGTDAGIALRVGYGERVSDRVGWWVGGTTSAGIRLIGTNPGLNPSFDAEAGVTWSLMDIWKDAQTLSRSFDLFARLPLQVQSAAPCVIPSGATRRPTWSAGLQVGISVLF